MPSYLDVFRSPGYAPIFLMSALSVWGDYIARLTVAAVVYERTRSPLATAGTLAVSLLPTIFGRSLLGPLADRFPYKHVLIASHLLRALLVLALIAAVAAQVQLGYLLLTMFVLEALGGPATSSTLVLMTDLFQDRRRYTKAFGLNTLADQFNQAVGFALGGVLVAALGPIRSLVVDLFTFLLSAAVLRVAVRLRPVVGVPAKGLVGFFSDIATGARHIVRHPVLARLLALSLVATLAISAPEALAIPYAGNAGEGGLLMASPILGAVLGLVLVGRWQPGVANARIILMALLMPLPLLGTVMRPPLVVTALLWFASGVLQAFMLPLQSTFSLLIPAERRGTVFGLAGAASVSAAGVAYLVAGWLSQHVPPESAVTICAVVAFGGLVLTAAGWPRKRLREAVQTAYGS